MKRWRVVENNLVIYSCAERDRQKAENFSLDYATDGIVVLTETDAEAVRLTMARRAEQRAALAAYVANRSAPSPAGPAGTPPNGE